MEVAGFREVIKVEFSESVYCIQNVVKEMHRLRKEGKIINILFHEWANWAETQLGAYASCQSGLKKMWQEYGYGMGQTQHSGSMV